MVMTAVNLESPAWIDRGEGSYPDRPCTTCRAVASLLGLTRAQFDGLAADLEPVWVERRLQALDRPGRLTRVGGGRKYSLSFSARLFLTVLHARWDVTYRALGALFGVGSQTVERACRDLRPLTPLASRPVVRETEQRGSRLLAAELERHAVSDGATLLREIGSGPCPGCTIDGTEA